jgi:hypothetical protein
MSVVIHAAGKEPVRQRQRQRIELGAREGVLARAHQPFAHRDHAGTDIGVAVHPYQALPAMTIEAEGAARAVELGRAREHPPTAREERHGQRLVRDGGQLLAIERDGARGPVGLGDRENAQVPTHGPITSPEPGRPGAGEPVRP